MSLAGDLTKLLSGKTKTTSSTSIDCGASGSDGSVNCADTYTGGTGGSSSSGFTDTATLRMRSDPNFASDQLTVKSRLGIVLRPMFVVSDNTALYLKVSYNQAKASGFGPAVTVRGPGYGFGFETNLSERWFLRAEIEQILYSGKQGDQAAAVDISSVGQGGATPGSANLNYSRGTMNVDTKVTAGTIAIGLRF